MKIIKIEDCIVCPFSRLSFNKETYRCYHTIISVRIIKNPAKIPDWCPLEDLGKFVSIKEIKGKKIDNKKKCTQILFIKKVALI